MYKLILLIGSTLLFIFGCALNAGNPGLKTRAYLYDAYHAWERGKTDQSVLFIQSALKSAECEKVPEDILVEVYDDAGLYFHVTGRHAESVRYQAIAVLLSRKMASAEPMRAFYQANLGKALEASGKQGDGKKDRFSTESLLAIPGVRDDAHIRRYYPDAFEI
jgi:hypothetical protein